MESLYDAWERFKKLQRQCPHHGLDSCFLAITFYNGCCTEFRRVLDSANNIRFDQIDATLALSTIEAMAAHDAQYTNTRSIPTKTNEDSSEVAYLRAQLAKLQQQMEAQEASSFILLHKIFKMLQSAPHQVVPSNPNSPSLQTPSASKLASQQASQSHQSNQPITLLTPKIKSSTLLSLLPPLPRAQALLLQIASLATKLFNVSSNHASWLSAFRGSLPTFLSSQIQSTSIPALDSSVSNTKEIASLFTSLQTQLLEAISELQEIQYLEDTKQKLNREIENNDAKILSFTKKLKEAERLLDILVDDYADYRRPKRSKSKDTENSSTTTTVASQLKLSEVISYAHKISYTTFTPPEFGAGGPLRGALPPAPQEDQMRASQLYTFADLDVGVPKMAEEKERAIEPLIEIPPLPEPDSMGATKGHLPPNFSVPVPAGWQPGMPVELLDLPLPPPGWKPGDPIPLPALESAPLLPPKSVHQQPRPAPPSAPTRAPEVVHVNPVDIRLPGFDDSTDEYSTSSEEMSDDND